MRASYATHLLLQGAQTSECPSVSFVNLNSCDCLYTSWGGLFCMINPGWSRVEVVCLGCAARPLPGRDFNVHPA